MQFIIIIIVFILFFMFHRVTYYNKEYVVVCLVFMLYITVIKCQIYSSYRNNNLMYIFILP